MIRLANQADGEAIWRIIGPVIREGETYTLDRDMDRESALQYWMGADNACFVAELDGKIVGTYYLRRNQAGGGAHVCNCGYMVAAEARGHGVARAMCEHSLETARRHGFCAMQFNFVVSTNVGALRLWENLGFQIVGRLPDAFDSPIHGPVDAYVMFRNL